MKANVLRIAGLAFTVLMMNVFVSKAQSTFYDTKKENGKTVSQTKYEKGYFGFAVKKSEAKYTYDENGDLLQKEVYVWTPTYKMNYKTGRACPDYSDSNWSPQYRVQYVKNSISNYVSIELSRWNLENNAYDSPIETMTYQLNDSNNLDYFAYQKGDKYNEVIR